MGRLPDHRSDDARHPPLPVAHPRLPPLSAIAGYIDEIDRNRNYSNYGPLNYRLEARLAGHFGVAPARVVTAANGTLALAAALMVTVPEPEPGALCLMPAWTFVATAHAARLAGLTPYFADVAEGAGPDGGMLTPEIAEAALRAAPGPVAAVMPVLPFGQPAALAPWDAFARHHRLAVVIDAAAGFDAVRPEGAPVMVSLHATKVLGIGEGGVIIGPNATFSEELRRRLNFGFYQVREALVPALNGKLSEYHAAVGLAALDLWPETRRAFQLAALNYRRAFTSFAGGWLPEGYGDRWVSSTTVLRLDRPEAEGLDRPEAEGLGRALAAQGIDTRRWWGPGVHRQPAFTDCPRTSLAVTNRLAETTLGLPCFPDLSAAAAVRVARAVDALTAASPPGQDSSVREP